MALNIEVELVALDLRELARRHYCGAGPRRSDMADVHLVADSRLIIWKQAVKGQVAGPFYQPDHRGGGKGAVAAHVLGDEVALDHAFHAAFEARPNTVGCRQPVDCP